METGLAVVPDQPQNSSMPTMSQDFHHVQCSRRVPKGFRDPQNLQHACRVRATKSRVAVSRTSCTTFTPPTRRALQSAPRLCTWCPGGEGATPQRSRQALRNPPLAAVLDWLNQTRICKQGQRLQVGGNKAQLDGKAVVYPSGQHSLISSHHRQQWCLNDSLYSEGRASSSCDHKMAT